MNRRAFLKTAASTGVALVSGATRPRLASSGLEPPRRPASSAAASIEVLLGEPIGIIPPELHGHFVEHLGGVVYDGIWVGEGSKVPNVGGIRKSLVDASARSPAGHPVARRLLADSRNWRDGSAPLRAASPTNRSIRPTGRAAGRSLEERHQRVRHERVLRFCRLVGAQPYRQ
jgi:alpha-N-arabinofuranosidase